MKTESKTQTYIARAPWVNGKRVNIGDEIELTEDQARHEPVDPKPAPAPRRSAKSGEGESA